MVHCKRQQWPERNPAVALLSTALPDADSNLGVSMAIDQIDRTVVTHEFLIATDTANVGADRPRSAVLGLAVASMRTLVMVVLATLAILVVLPAAIAAQAAVGI